MARHVCSRASGPGLARGAIVLLLVTLGASGCAPGGALGHPGARPLLPSPAPAPGAREALRDGVPAGVATSALSSALERPRPGAAEIGFLARPLRERPLSWDRERRYVLLPGVTLAPAVEEKVAEIAELYFQRTGKELVVTSGTRDPARQAEAMHDLFRHGADVLGLYRDKAAAREIKRAYDEGVAADLPADARIEAIEQVIRAQMERGVFISAHLREGAVDIRNRDMTPVEKRAFLDGVEEVGGVLALEESRPPHYHLQID